MALCVLFVCAVVTGVWRLRLHQVRRQFSTIIGERVRLSRELHDTLLQNFVAIALQFDAVAADDDASPDLRRRLVLARKEVEENIREARQMIFDLRSSQNHRRDLVAALRALGQHATVDRRIDFELTVTGEVRPCPARVQDELLRIGQEAVANAVRHACASHIRMTLDFAPSGITLHVSDDGRGFDSAAPVDVESGHYGLTVMRERAQQIGAVLEVSSEVDKGTHVRAVVPLAA
jgi:signal transduction histidine kinase